ncbi:MAG: flavoprotein [Candidatus Omnitrophota bacterium]
MAKGKIVLGMTGSIACYRTCDLVRRLRESRYEARCIMTQEAQEFVRPLLFEVLSGHKVYTDLFEAGQVEGPAHALLAQWADLVLVAPCSANLIGKLAHGIYDDLLTCVVSATQAKVVLCPAMNEVMYRQPAVQANIRLLKKWGHQFVGPIKGPLACHVEGIGHIASSEEIIAAVKRVLH